MPSADTRLEPIVPGPTVVAGRRTEVAGIPVERVLPGPAVRTVGAWCLADRFGPVDPRAVPMLVPPHPHIGLHTVTWLLSGELLHRDSLGNEQLLRPGQVNVMTAGHGISHAEETPADTTGSVLHGFQLWIAQPEATRHGPAAFKHHKTVPTLELGPHGRALVFLDAGLPGSPRVDTDLSGVDVTLTGPVDMPVPANFEHAVVVTHGEVLVEGVWLNSGMSIHLNPGRSILHLGATAPARLLVLGGPPFPEPVRMSWNFVARTADELESARRDWETGASRFGVVASPLPAVPAPAPHRRS